MSERRIEGWVSAADAIHVLGRGDVKVYPSKEYMLEHAPESSHKDYTPTKITILLETN